MCILVLVSVEVAGVEYVNVKCAFKMRKRNNKDIAIRSFDKINPFNLSVYAHVFPFLCFFC